MVEKRKTIVIGVVIIAALIILSVVIGILLLRNNNEFIQKTGDVNSETTHLFGANMNRNDEIIYVNAILDEIPLHCYNVGIYDGTGNGTVVIYNDMLELIQNGTRPHNPIMFIDNSLVREYFALNCLHLDNMKQVPKNFTSDIGLNQTEMLKKWNLGT